ncbi:MAG TPA: methylmalonyl-CoA mutase family protein, partial [Casimicrobiaceae bacterium]
MNDLSVASKALVYKPVNKVRFVTAASLFDGHDASINIMRRILQGSGCEVIHLGHNRSVEEIVTCALQEDAGGIAISSYQGGHVEFFTYMLDLLRQRGGAHIKIFGGGGGVIVPDEIRALHDYGVTRIFSPEDGQKLGLQGMINEMVAACDAGFAQAPPDIAGLDAADANQRVQTLARLISVLEAGTAPPALRAAVATRAQASQTPVLGVTGTGGAGKSSLTDELIRRFRLDQDDALSIAIVSIDPSRRKSGGALLGDRIRMNAIASPSAAGRIYMRSLATRNSFDSPSGEISNALPDAINACKAAGYDLVIVETSGIGQGDAAIVAHVDVSLYVMTPEFGAASQLEKIDMLDFADFVAINKFDRKGAADALRDVRKQVQRNRERFREAPDAMPVFGTIASRFNDDGVTALYQALAARLADKGLPMREHRLAASNVRHSTGQNAIVPPARTRYLAEIAAGVRDYRGWAEAQSRTARERQQLRAAAAMLTDGCRQMLAGAPVLDGRADAAADCKHEHTVLDRLIDARDAQLDASSKKLLDMWPQTKKAYSGDEYVVKIRGKEVRTDLVYTTLSGTRVPKVALPRWDDDGEILRWQLLENVPGSFPYTAGVFAFKRRGDEDGEDPTRMFAGEGDPFRTNKRFHLLADGMSAQRLSTAFDSVTLYGFDPDPRPDIYGKVGNSGVSIATLDDMKVLYAGFDL